jgi:hypothetical protein
MTARKTEFIGGENQCVIDNGTCNIAESLRDQVDKLDRRTPV